jgi:hypothetical protein
MSRTHPALLLPALICITIPLSGCAALYDDTCGVESRSVDVFERIPGVQRDSIGYASLQIGETREAGTRNIRWMIGGTDLRGRLHSARLVASEDTSYLLVPVSGGPAEPDIAIDGGIMPYAGPVSFDELFDRIRTGKLTLILETDLNSSPLVAVPLLHADFQDWSQPHCS